MEEELYISPDLELGMVMQYENKLVAVTGSAIL